MSANRKVKSLRSKYISIMALFVTFAFVGGHFAVSYFVFEHLEEDIAKDTIERGNMIANRSANFIIEDKFNEYKLVLNGLEALPRFNYVHIYQMKNDALEFFSSYNKKGFPAIPSKEAFIEQYKTPVITENIVELIYPVIHNESLIGYAYIQLSAEHLYHLRKTSFFTLAIGYIIFLLAGIYIAIRMQRSVANAVSYLVTDIREISQKRNYQKRFVQMNTLEFEVLANNLNILLSRTEKFIKKQGDAEQEILKLNHELEDKVSQRTEALKESNQELLSTLEKLHQFQGQLVESEKMASLGDMVAGVAHEVNTPIGLGVTASTLLSDRLNEIKTAFEDKTLKSSQLKRFLNEGQENVGIIYRNLNRAADLISSFKKVAVDQSSEEDRAFKVHELIDEVILTLAPQLKHKTVDLQIECPKSLSVISKPGPINQILINLIVNSIIHGFEGSDEGVINLNIMQLSGQLHISYRDNGKGVEQALRNKIFDPFITTKRGEGGSGLGLHLVYNLVTQALGGNIQFDSEVGNGVHFEINFPVIVE
ncbi:sensor histidine kinase [Thalassotalea sp. M1531]|uniref:histidine kinase n=1 Tax=Thalassotalea algicola TaxID=2716224 RepID=A0A7Y0LA56_9GAMM|nr:ATP-binding protein [Thalassotalea algicola]NMP30327.1 sensor histidine kinase [Thalassotalea algicola]